MASHLPLLGRTNRLAVAAGVVFLASGCAVGSAVGTTSPPSTSPPSTSPSFTTARTPSAATVSHAAPMRTHPPVVVIDPGHSRTIAATDPRTGLVVSDYENEPEMRDVFAVAVLVRGELRADGYRVVMTKSRVGQRRDLAQRSAIANHAGAALALSIHDQAGPNGGIHFRAGNNIVYYQSVGKYRATPGGRKIVFTDRRVAALSKKYAAIFGAQRHHAQRVPIRVQGDVGYDLGSRGLAAGDIWTVQLLSHVPWIYNEAGGNSAGRSGLDEADRRTYAAGLVAAVEHCVPLNRRSRQPAAGG